MVQTTDSIMYSISIILSEKLFPNLLEKSKQLGILMFNMGKQWGCSISPNIITMDPEQN